jgi:hypothetical protein
MFIAKSQVKRFPILITLGVDKRGKEAMAYYGSLCRLAECLSDVSGNREKQNNPRILRIELTIWNIYRLCLMGGFTFSW